ncbi:MAG TPA: DUF1343 domain-containing protein [Candidatus Sumerlaeota bacterium]|nr:DUF1343 domain-containing protein [Candidatus Sumerlaeota bacterium]
MKTRTILVSLCVFFLMSFLLPAADVYPGIDVLVERGFAPIQGKNIGLITNHTGISREGKSSIDILFETDKCQLKALFSPEHGIRGTSDEKVATGVDEKTSLTIHSLYGKTQKPTPDMLEGLDVLVFDIQDIGTRFYTYIGTMSYAMKAAKENGLKFVVLDRPNTIGGAKVEGGIPPLELCGKNTCIHPIPTRHGMTVGELALLFNKEFGIGCDLEVVPCKNWKRDMLFDQTGLMWLNPSPNMKTLNGAILYPGLGVAETTTLSCGRGTDRPFEMYGAPYVDGETVARELNSRNIPGIRFIPWTHIPTAQYHQFKDEVCPGVFAIILDREKLDSVTAGLHMIQVIQKHHPEKHIDRGGFKTETGDPEAWDKLTNKKMTPEEIVKGWQKDLDKFMEVRACYLLYQ